MLNCLLDMHFVLFFIFYCYFINVTLLVNYTWSKICGKILLANYFICIRAKNSRYRAGYVLASSVSQNTMMTDTSVGQYYCEKTILKCHDI